VAASAAAPFEFGKLNSNGDVSHCMMECSGWNQAVLARIHLIVTMPQNGHGTLPCVGRGCHPTWAENFAQSGRSAKWINNVFAQSYASGGREGKRRGYRSGLKRRRCRPNSGGETVQPIQSDFAGIVSKSSES
jgi:hypothetical protein